MHGYVINIEQATLENSDFRRVLYTAKYSQLVLMNLKPSEEIGEETHTLDQFIRVERGEGVAVLNGETHEITDGFAIVVPAGVTHNIRNTGTNNLKLYTLYAPPEHRDGVVEHSKTDVVEEHFDGKTTEQ